MCIHEFFSHDYMARSNPKLQFVISELGVAGYGCFWAIIEELYKRGNEIPVKDLPRLSKVFRAPKRILTRVMNDYDLFFFYKNEQGEEFFRSESVARRLAKRDEATRKKRGQRADNEQGESISDKRRRAAMARWGKADANASAYASACEVHMHTDASAMHNAPYIYTNDNSSSLTTTTSLSPMQNANVHTEQEQTADDLQEAEATASATPAVRPQDTPTPLPPSRTAEDIAGEVRELMRNENIRYQLHQKSGGMEMAYISAFVPEFAGQLALQGNTETGTKLAMHFGYWLGRKNEALKRQNKNSNERDKKQQYRRDMQAALGARVLGVNSIDDILNAPAS